MSDDRDTVLVTGATGSTGGEVLRALAGTEAPVRAGVRRPGDDHRLPSPAVPVHLDFDDPSSLDQALDSVRTAYLVSPSSERAEQQQIDFVDRAAAAGVRRVVLLSQLGAEADSPVRFLRYHAAVEARVRDAGLGFTFLRPNLFFQGLLAFADQIAGSGSFGAPIGDARVSLVDVRDIGDVAAAALLDDRHEGETYTLTGPAGVTHAEIAAALGASTGTEVTFTDASEEDFASALSGVLPDWQLAGLLEDYAHYRRGEAAATTAAVEEVTGHAPRSITDFARDHATAFQRRADR